MHLPITALLIGTSASALANAAPPTFASGTPVPPGLNTVPACAYPALMQLFQDSGCADPTDASCLCTKPRLFTQLIYTVQQACPSKSDQNVIRTFAQSFCGPAMSSAVVSATGTITTTEGAVAAVSSTAHETSSSSVSKMSSSMASKTSSASGSISTDASTGGGDSVRGELGIGSMAALAIAVGGMTWVLAEY